ncbi:MAG: ATP-binding protein [Nitrososphaera sp.]
METLSQPANIAGLKIIPYAFQLRKFKIYLLYYFCKLFYNTVYNALVVYLLTSMASPNVERTEVFYGSEDAMKILLQVMHNVKQEAVTCSDAQSAGFSMTVEPVKQGFIDFKKRGVKIRSITEITMENLKHCKELEGYVQLRHLDGLKGNFAVSESEYVATAIINEKEPVTETIYSNAKAILEQHRYFFETLWSRAIPAEQRIREIEEGIKPEIIETIREPKATQERTFDLIKSANEEILVIFSTANAFRRQEKSGALDLLMRNMQSKNLKVRILSPFDDYVRSLIEEIKRRDEIRIEIRNIEESFQTQISVLIVDRTSMLSAEVKSDSKESSLEAIGFTTYSNSKPTVLSYASIFESLWNQTRLYQETRQLYQELKSHEKMKQEFIDIAAHELRTPIQPILGLSQILKDQISDPTQTKYLDIILRNAKRLQQLQADTIDVIRIESGTMKFRKEAFNLNELIFYFLQDFNSQLEDYYNKINVNYKSDGDVWVIADKNRIIQVISNLLDNAIKFTKVGSILVQLTEKRMAKKIEDANQVIVSIKDEGPGIDPSIMPRLFTKFASKSEKGTGLGLFISKSIIIMHGSEIWAENNSDERGATFAFTLPVHKPH